LPGDRITINHAAMGNMRDYFGQARARAQKRRSPWMLLVLAVAFPATIAGCIGLTVGLVALHNLVHPDSLHTLRTGEWYIPFLVIATLFAAMPLGLALGNAVAHLIPASRTAFETKGGPPYKTAQRQMGLAFVLIAFPSLLIGLLYVAFG
jgi:hypothetical protein